MSPRSPMVHTFSAMRALRGPGGSALPAGESGRPLWDALLRVFDQTSTAANWSLWLEEFLGSVAKLVDADAAMFVGLDASGALRVDGTWNVTLTDEAVHTDLDGDDGLIARVWRADSLVFDAVRDRGHALWSGTEDVASMLGLPCASDDERVGVMVVGWRSPRGEVDPDALRALKTVTRYLASAKRRHDLAVRASAHEAQARHASRLYAALSQVNRAIVRSTEAEELLQRVCDAAAVFADLSLAWIGWMDEAAGALRPEVWHGGPAAFVHAIRRRPGGVSGHPHSLAALALARAQVQVVPDVTGLPESFPLRERTLAAGDRSLALAPIQAGPRRGILALYAAQPGFFGDADVALLEEMAANIAYGLSGLESTNELRKSEAALRSVFDTVRDGLVLIDDQGRIEMANRAMAGMFGRDADGLVGSGVEVLMTEADRDRVPRRLIRNAAVGRGRGGAQSAELLGQRADGSTFPLELSVGEARTAEGVRYAGAVRDLTHQKTLIARLEHLAFHDPVTGALSRPGLAKAFASVRAGLRRSGGAERIVLLRLDVDSFGAVNTALGEPHGDQVLGALARRLRNAAGPDGAVARTGGDEFTVLHRLGPEENLARFLRDLARHAGGRYRVGGQSHHVRVSAGVAVFPEHGTDLDVLWRRADVALAAAKREGGDVIRTFDPETERFHLLELGMSERVLAALGNGEFVLHYQPQVDLVAGAVRAVEALIRWQPPERPLVMPGDFLPYIHDRHTIGRLGDWVLSAALGQWRTWQAQGVHVRVAVNVSAEHFLAPGFARRLRQLLARDGALGKDALEIEITETAALRIPEARKVMEACRRLGVPVVLDDFGTGYSSISYLNELPFDALKVDAGFTREMIATAEGWAIVQAILLMGTAADRQVIAEGVESAVHEEALARLGVRFAQGFAYARPMEPGRLAGWMERWSTRRFGGSTPAELGHAAEYMTAVYLHTRWVHRLLLWARHQDAALDGREMVDEGLCLFTRWLNDRSAVREPLRALADAHAHAHREVRRVVSTVQGDGLAAALGERLRVHDARILEAVLAAVKGER